MQLHLLVECKNLRLIFIYNKMIKLINRDLALLNYKNSRYFFLVKEK